VWPISKKKAVSRRPQRKKAQKQLNWLNKKKRGEGFQEKGGGGHQNVRGEKRGKWRKKGTVAFNSGCPRCRGEGWQSYEVDNEMSQQRRLGKRKNGCERRGGGKKAGEVQEKN